MTHLFLVSHLFFYIFAKKQEMRYNTILIVGNGFDLNLGLKTSYREFIESEKIKEYRKNHSNNLINYLRIQNQYKWIDIEAELKNYSTRLFEQSVVQENFLQIIIDILANESRRRKKRNFRTEYEELCKILKSYLSQVTKDFPTEIYNSASYKILREVCHKPSFHIISFNYTYSVERIINGGLYSLGGYKMDRQVQHIHGSLEEDIVFGIEDGGGVHSDHIFLYKSHNPNQKIHGLHADLNETQELIFFGYSLGQTDHSYFDDFFKQQSRNGCNRKKLTFYYYDNDAYDNLIIQLNTLTDHRLSKLKEYNWVEFKKVSDIE